MTYVINYKHSQYKIFDWKKTKFWCIRIGVGAVRYTAPRMSYHIPYHKLRYEKISYIYLIEFFGIPQCGIPKIWYDNFRYRYHTVYAVYHTVFRYTALLRYTEMMYDIPSMVYQNKVWYTIIHVFHTKKFLFYNQIYKIKYHLFN